MDGADGYMGNAIAWLALEAGYQVVGHVPLARFADSVPEKSPRQVRRGPCGAREAHRLPGGRQGRPAVQVTTEIGDLAGLRAGRSRRGWRTGRSRPSSTARSEASIGPDAVVASNSSSMGPAVLARLRSRKAAAIPHHLLNLHFFSPAEHPMMQLVEVIHGARRPSDDAVATAHAFVRKIDKTPVLMRDGSPGFLVNAGLAVYFAAAETLLYREGTPVEKIDAAPCEAAVFPMGPFEMGDQAGLDVAAGMYDTLAAEEPPPVTEPLVWKMRTARSDSA